MSRSKYVPPAHKRESEQASADLSEHNLAILNDEIERDFDLNAEGDDALYCADYGPCLKCRSKAVRSNNP